MRFIHVSDLHIVPAGQQLHGLDPAANLRACVADINRIVEATGRDGSGRENARFCVFTGDLVEAGDADSYRLLRDILQPLELPHYLMIGNHDSRDAFYQVFDEYQPDSNGFLQYAFTTPAGLFVMLDTLEAGSPGGRLCPQRLDWLTDLLAQYKGQPVYLFMHHPAFDIAIPLMDRFRLQNPQDLRQVIAPYDVRHIFFGHTHRPLSGQWHGVPFSGVPSSVHQVATDFVSDNFMPYDHGPPAYSFVDVTGPLTLVQTQHFLTEHQNPRRLPDERWTDATGN